MTPTWSTAIARVDVDDVVIRGYSLSELVGSVTFVDMVFLVHTGELPSPERRRVLDAIFVTLIEHGISPSTIITRELASCGTPAQAAIAGGVLSIADWHGGSGEELAGVLVELLAKVDAGQDVDDVAADFVADRRARGLRFEGFGHPQHRDGDPRAHALLSLAEREGVAAGATGMLGAVAAAIESSLGRKLPPNVTGAIAAVLLDLGFSWRAVRGMVIAPRAAGLAAHVVEELEQGGRWRHASADDIEYTGQPARSLANEGDGR